MLQVQSANRSEPSVLSSLRSSIVNGQPCWICVRSHPGMVRPKLPGMFNTSSTASVSRAIHHEEKCSRRQGRLGGCWGMSAVGLSSGIELSRRRLRALGSRDAHRLAMHPHLRFGLGLRRSSDQSPSFAGASGIWRVGGADSLHTAHKAVARPRCRENARAPHYAAGRLHEPCRLLPRRRPIAKRRRIRKLICFCRYVVRPIRTGRASRLPGGEHPAYKRHTSRRGFHSHLFWVVLHHA